MGHSSLNIWLKNKFRNLGIILRGWSAPTSRKESKMKDKGEGQRVKPSTPSRATDALIGDEEQNRKQERKKKEKQGADH